MATRKSTFVFLVMIGGILATILGRGSRLQHTASNRPAGGQALPSREMEIKRQTPRLHGKRRVPAGLFVDLVQPERSGHPASILVSASTDVSITSGVLTLRVPPMGVEPGRTELLWAGEPSDLLAEAQEYTVGALPEGKHHFVAILEFMPDRENAERLALSKSLYLDVRSDKILSSNVSFRQIERLELYSELEHRALVSISPGLAAADPRTMARYRRLIEEANPGLIAEEIASLRAADPEVARRIRELNSTKVETAN